MAKALHRGGRSERLLLYGKCSEQLASGEGLVYYGVVDGVWAIAGGVSMHAGRDGGGDRAQGGDAVRPGDTVSG